MRFMTGICMARCEFNKRLQVLYKLYHNSNTTYQTLNSQMFPQILHSSWPWLCLKVCFNAQWNWSNLYTLVKITSVNEVPNFTIGLFTSTFGLKVITSPLRFSTMAEWRTEVVRTLENYACSEFLSSLFAREQQWREKWRENAPARPHTAIPMVIAGNFTADCTHDGN